MHNAFNNWFQVTATSCWPKWIDSKSIKYLSISKKGTKMAPMKQNFGNTNLRKLRRNSLKQTLQSLSRHPFINFSLKRRNLKVSFKLFFIQIKGIANKVPQSVVLVYL